MRRLGGDPFAALERLQQALDRVVEAPSPAWTSGLSGRVFPPVNVFADAKTTRIRIEVPGMKTEDFGIETHGNKLTIKGGRATPIADRGNPHRRERWAGEFSRSFEMPAELWLEKATASYANGILTVEIPQREETQTRQIAVHSP